MNPVQACTGLILRYSLWFQLSDLICELECFSTPVSLLIKQASSGDLSAVQKWSNNV